MGEIISVGGKPYVMKVTLGVIERLEEQRGISVFNLAASGELQAELNKVKTLCTLAYEALEPANAEFKKCSYAEFMKEHSDFKSFTKLATAVGEALAAFFPKTEETPEGNEGK